VNGYPVIIVAGLGRCGSSLMMQMLQAGGIECVGEFPSFEIQELNHAPQDSDWWHAKAGKAVKLLDPHFSPVPHDVNCIAIWMKRDFFHQAKSQMKFSLMLSGYQPQYDRQHLKAMERSLKRETPIAIANLGGCPILPVLFEDVITNPPVMAVKVSKFLGKFWLAGNFSPLAAARAAILRPLECAPGLEIEMQLCKDRRSHNVQRKLLV